MEDMERGEASIRLTRAAALGGGFPSDVPNTPANQDLFAKIKSDIAAMPEDIIPDVPYDYNMETHVREAGS